LPCIIAFLLLSSDFSRADYDDAKKNHPTLKSAVVKPTLQNVFIQPLMPSARERAHRKHERTIMSLTVAVKKISSVRVISRSLPVAATAMQPKRAGDRVGGLALQVQIAWLI